MKRPKRTPEPQQTGVCRWCHAPVVRRSDGDWIHTSRRIECLDPWGYTLPITAEPQRHRRF